MSASTGRKIDLTKVPLAFALGTTLKKAAHWNQMEILTGGTYVTAEIIAEYEDISLYVPVSVRIEGSFDDTRRIIETNIQNFKQRQQAKQNEDLSEAYDEGQIVFEQGDTQNQDCYFLVEGSLKVVIGGNEVATISEPGQPIGEMSFLTGEARTASIVAGANCKLLRLRKSDKRKIMKENPTIVDTILQALIKRLADTSTKFSTARTEANEAQGELKRVSAELEAAQSFMEGNADAPVAQAANPEMEGALAKAKDDNKRMAQYAAAQAGSNKGNIQLFEKMFAILARHGGGEETLPPLLRAYSAYLKTQKLSKAVEGQVDRDSLPPELKAILDS